MRPWKSILFSAAMATGAALPAHAQTINLVANGSFESGLAGWSQGVSAPSVAGTCAWNTATAGGTETVTGTAAFPTTDGTSELLGSVEQTAIGNRICVLYQDIRIPAGITTGVLSADLGLKLTGAQAAVNSATFLGLYPTTSIPHWNDVPVTGANTNMILTGTAANGINTLITQTPITLDLSSVAGTTVRFAIINGMQSPGVGTQTPIPGAGGVAGADKVRLTVVPPLPPPPIPQLPINVDTSGSGQGAISLASALSALPPATTFTAQSPTGEALPAWLAFDSTTRSFTYNVPLPSDLPIQPLAAAGDVTAVAADAGQKPAAQPDTGDQSSRASRATVPNQVYPLSVLVANIPVLLTANAPGATSSYLVNMDFYAPRNPVAITAISYSAGGRSGNAESSRPALSWDGGQLLFQTLATNIHSSSSGHSAVGRYHGLSGKRDLLSQTAIPGGGVANGIDGPATSPAVSANGAFGAFSAAAPGVTITPSSSLRQVYRTSLAYPRVALNETTTPPPVMVSTTSANVAANAPADNASLSEDGNLVAFESAATNLGANAGGTVQIWRKTVPDGTIVLVSANAQGVAGNGDSRNVSLSWNGRFAAFDSTSTNLVPGVSGRQVYLKDLQTGGIFVISTTAGVAGNQASTAPKLDARAGSLVFASRATNIGTGGNAFSQVWRFDVATGALTLVSQTPTGTAGNQDADQPTVSADGRFIAFRSAATDLVPGTASGGATQIWVRDVLRGITALVSQTDAGLPGTGASADPAFSGDGGSIGFTSQARDLVNGTPLPGQIHLAGNPLVMPGRTAHWYTTAGGNQAWAVERWGNRAYVSNMAYHADGGAGTWVAGICTFSGLTCSGPLNEFVGGTAMLSRTPASVARTIGTVAVTFDAAGTGATLTINGGGTQALKIYPVLGTAITGFAGLPQNGWWYNTGDIPGANGIFISTDTQAGTNGTVRQATHLTLYSYDTQGKPVWYAAEGNLTSDGSLAGTLLLYAGGAPVGTTGGSVTPSSGLVGDFRLSFPATDRAVLQLPGGTTTFTRFRF